MLTTTALTLTPSASAREAGFGTRLVVREGNVPVADANGHIAIDSFDALL